MAWNTKPPTIGEVRAILKNLKRGTAPGPDGITTDLVKDLNEEGLEEIRKLIRGWWLKKQVPSSLTLARVVSLYKKATQESKKTIDQLVCSTHFTRS